jgi:transposase-like protein
MAYLDLAQRYKALFAWQKCRNISKVARDLKISKNTVRRWVRRHHATGNLAVMPGKGRKPSMDTKAACKAVDMLLSGKFAGARQVAAELHKQGITKGRAPLSRTTVVRHAKAYAAAQGRPIRASRTKPAKQLNEHTVKARLGFCLANKSRNSGNVLFTDRKKFTFTYPGCSVKQVGWVWRGQQRQAARVNKAMVVNLYAGVCKYGVTNVHSVAGTSKLASGFKNKKGQVARNITASEYRHVVSSTLLPEARRLFTGAGVSHFVIM